MTDEEWMQSLVSAAKADAPASGAHHTGWEALKGACAASEAPLVQPASESLAQWWNHAALASKSAALKGVVALAIVGVGVGGWALASRPAPARSTADAVARVTPVVRPTADSGEAPQRGLAPASGWTGQPPVGDSANGADDTPGALDPRAPTPDGAHLPAAVPSGSDKHSSDSPGSRAAAKSPSARRRRATGGGKRPHDAAPPSKRPAPDPTDDVVAETALLLRAWAALRGGKELEALRVARQHAAQFPHGALVEERHACRTIALCRLGRGVQARRAAEGFLSQHPRSVHEPKVRAACAAGVDAPSK